MKVQRLAYITSMATGGLAGFNYKELMELQRLGLNIELFITKSRPGPYMPPAGVPWWSIRAGAALLAAFISCFRQPLELMRLFLESVRHRCLVDLLVATHWSRLIRKSGRTWIHCHWGDHKLYIGYFMHRLVGIPLSVTLHGYDLYANPNWAMCERALRACSQIVTISEYNRNLLIRRFGDLAARVKVIRLFAEFVPDPDLLKKKKKVLIVGGFQDRKGYDVLLPAIKILNREDLQLWIVGYRGPVDVAGIIKELELESKVTIFGHVSDDVLKVLYTYCDIFCMPSRLDKDGVGEGLPVALMEAMSYQKPVVSTFHTGIPELVPEILVPENDAVALAAAIARLADDPDLRCKMGRRNREVVLEQYSAVNVKLLQEACWAAELTFRPHAGPGDTSLGGVK